ncbi:hypothetical protein BT69DRAFT_1230418 [Atractiella rhizophila]|nr:hypothetical protein BT69DRAFT_1230418 [Atractiella rhizophila]
MPSTSSFSSAEKSLIKKQAPTARGDKVLTAGIARIYYCARGESSWSYTGLEGAIVFGKGETDDGETRFWFRLIDFSGKKGGVIWEHELYRGLEYRDRGEGLHEWEADDGIVGFLFSEDGEAVEFFKKVNTRAKHMKKAKSESSSKESSKKKKKGGISKDMISGPDTSTFKHVSHMGFDSTKGFTTENIDPTWEKFLEQLSGMGISKSDIAANQSFIKEFVAQSGGLAKKPAAPPAPKRGAPPPAPTRRGAPPPAPASRASRPAPPPAPASYDAAPPPPPPPPPPPMGGGAPPPPPPPHRQFAAVVVRFLLHLHLLHRRQDVEECHHHHLLLLHHLAERHRRRLLLLRPHPFRLHKAEGTISSHLSVGVGAWVRSRRSIRTRPALLPLHLGVLSLWQTTTEEGMEIWLMLLRLR